MSDNDESKSEDAQKGAKSEGAKKNKMHAFRGNSFDEYYDHGMKEFPLPARAFMGFAVTVVWIYTKIVWPWKLEEADKITEDARGKVIIMNHSSMLDPVIIVTSLYHKGIRVRTIYKTEFDSTKVVTWAFSRLGGFPVDRGTADMKTIRRARTMLQRGECVLIYPEGTRIKHDSDAVSRGGFAIIAQLANAPVYPVASIGSRNLHFRQHSYTRFGKPIEWSDIAPGKRKARAAEMERVGMERVYEVRDELRKEHPEIKED